MNSPAKKKLQEKASVFGIYTKRTIIFVVVILIVLLFSLSTVFLSDQSSPRKDRRNLLTTHQDTTPQPERIKQDNLNQSTPDTNDIFFGPIRLKGSGYVGDQLTTYVDENSTPSSSSEKIVNAGTDGESVATFSDFISHPVETISNFTSAYIVDYTNNSRKTTLIKLIDAVSRYYVSYNHFPLNGQQSESSYDWIDEMVEKNEMSGVYSYVLEKSSPVSYCGSVEQTGYCFDSNGQNAIIYVQLDQSSTQPKCRESSLYFLWSSEDNRLGELCMDSSPNSLSGFTFLKD